jgi:hypothetical protein
MLAQATSAEKIPAMQRGKRLFIVERKILSD